MTTMCADVAWRAFKSGWLHMVGGGEKYHHETAGKTYRIMPVNGSCQASGISFLLILWMMRQKKIWVVVRIRLSRRKPFSNFSIPEKDIAHEIPSDMNGVHFMNLRSFLSISHPPINKISPMALMRKSAPYINE